MQQHPILQSTEIRTAVERLADDIVARHGSNRLALVGIHTRGVVLANRLARALHHRGVPLDQGTLDISLYRDDLENLAALPHVQGSDIPFDVADATIVLCDDVLFTGRTIRAAMNVLLDYGRPERIELAVLADRGHRELPIAPTYTGVVVTTGRRDYLRAHFRETDGEDLVIHYTPETP